MEEGEVVARPRVDPLKRMARRIVLAGDCWEYGGGKTHDGYAQIWVATDPGKGEKVYAHRLAYERWVGPIPEGHEVDHLCRNRACVNPIHLEPVTHKENILRGDSFASVNAKKGRCPQGHEYTPENTYQPNRGGRSCRACRRVRG